MNAELRRSTFGRNSNAWSWLGLVSAEMKLDSFEKTSSRFIPVITSSWSGHGKLW